MIRQAFQLRMALEREAVLAAVRTMPDGSLLSVYYLNQGGDRERWIAASLFRIDG